MKISIVSLLVVLPWWVHAAEGESDFIKRVTNIVEARDLIRWSALFCNARSSSDADALMLDYFSSIKTSPLAMRTRREITHDLFVCAKYPFPDYEDKELCSIFWIARVDDHSCLLEP